MSIPIPGRILPLAPGTFRALRHADFRYLWLGQVVSLFGTWMQSAAQGWLVLQLSNSPFALGLVGFCTFAPTMLFALVAGVAADRFSRRHGLMWTQGSQMALAVLLTALTAAGVVRVWHVAILAFLNGTAAAFDIPIRQSLLQDLVGREDLSNAIALNSMAFNAARLAGPAAAGFLIAGFGEAACFGLNALSFAAVLAAVWRMRPPGRRTSHPATWTREILDGLGFALRSVRARTLLLLIVVSSLFGAPYSILMPVFARDVLGAGPRGLGLLMGSAGLGAVLGALHLAGRRSYRGAGTIVAIAMASFGASLVAFSFSRALALSMALLVGVGASMISQLATSNTLLQLAAPEALRGRIISLYMLSFVGMAPFGSLLSGWAARQFGAPVTVRVGGAVCLVAALTFALRLSALRRAAGVPPRAPAAPA